VFENDAFLAILHRENSVFYKIECGAFGGDRFMSLIHTCRRIKANAFDYLTALLEHHALVRKNHQDCVPWNFTSALPQSNK
jgi:hypothetical protein